MGKFQLVLMGRVKSKLKLWLHGDDALEGDEEEETDQLVSQVLDEIGVDLNSQLVHAPAHVAAAPAQTTPSKVAQPTGAFNAGDDAGIDSDLQAHFDNLRKICCGLGGPLVGPAKIHGNVELAEHAARQLLALDPDSSSWYVLLSYIYATIGMPNKEWDIREINEDKV
ncbi:unnamed protein product [Sphagnum troendelagicum]